MDKDLSESTQNKVDTVVDRHIPRHSLNKYLSEQLARTSDGHIFVRLPGEVVIETGRDVLDEVHGNPYTAGVEQ